MIYYSKDKINWKDQIVCPKCDEPTKKQWIPNGGSGYWRCKICKTKILDAKSENSESRLVNEDVIGDVQPSVSHHEKGFASADVNFRQ